MMNIKKIAFILLTFFTINSYAQEVTDFDLGRFAHAYKSMVKLNLDAQEQMAKIIEKNDLTIEEFHAINDTKANPELEPDLPKEKFESFDKIQNKLKNIQSKLEQDVEDAYAKYDLTKREYNAIAERVKQDIVLQTKMEKILANIK